jgi:hypothetical protein
MRTQASKKTQWFFFDLDDALHSFRAASSSTINAVLQLILEQLAHLRFPSQDSLSLSLSLSPHPLTHIYANLPNQHVYRFYRREKQAMSTAPSLLTAFSLPQQVNSLLDVYEGTLTASLVLTPGLSKA